MNRRELEDKLDLYAAGALDDAERDAVREQLSRGDPALLGKLAEAEALLAQLGLSALTPTTAVPTTAKSKLDARLDDLLRAQPAPAVRSGTPVMMGVDDQVGEAERAGLRIAGNMGDSRTAPAAIRPVIAMNDFPASSHGNRRVFSWLIPSAIAALIVGAVTGGIMYSLLRDEQRKVDGLLSEVNAVRGAKELAEEQLDKAEAEQTEWTEKLATAEKKLEEVGTKMAALEKDVTDAQAKLATSAAEVARLKTAGEASQTAVASAEAEVRAAKAELESFRQTVEMLYSKQLLTVELVGQEAAPAAKARLLVDLQNKVWKLYTTDLKPLDGRVYEFWLITDSGQKVPMGSFTPDATGRGSLGNKVPDPLPKLVSAAITDEPAPGALQPTGAMRAVGQIR